MDFSTRLDKLLKENNMTALRLTQELGINRNTISDWKRGKSTPSPNILTKIADIFNVSIDYLLKGENQSQEIAKPQKGKVIFTVNGFGGPQEHFEVDEEDWEVVRAMTDALRKKRDEKKRDEKKKNKK